MAVHHVAEELALGLGVRPPELYATDDAAPNALSAHGLRRMVIVHTAGAAELPRAEIEALLAHEMGHLHAVDARGGSPRPACRSGTPSGTRTRCCCSPGWCLAVFLLGWQIADLLLVSWLIGAALLAAVGALADRALGAAKHRVRSDADDVADVAAVRLARHPEALGQLLTRLEHETSVVAHSNWRTAMLWFEEMPEPGDPTEGVDRTHRGTAPSRAVPRMRPPTCCRPPPSPRPPIRS